MKAWNFRLGSPAFRGAVSVSRLVLLALVAAIFIAGPSVARILAPPQVRGIPYGLEPQLSHFHGRWLRSRRS